MGDAKLTAEGRVDKVELCADECNSSSWVVLRVDAIRIAEEHAAAAVAEHQARVAELEALLRQAEDFGVFDANDMVGFELWCEVIKTALAPQENK